MRKKFLIAGLILILVSSGLMYLGVQEQIKRFGYAGSYPIFQTLDPGLRAFLYNTLFALIMTGILGLVFRWKFKPSYYWVKTGEDYQYEYYERKRESPTMKKIKYSFTIVFLYFVYSLFPLSYTGVGQPITVPFFGLVGAIVGTIGIITGATGFIKKKPKPPPKVVTPTTPTAPTAPS